MEIKLIKNLKIGDTIYLVPMPSIENLEKSIPNHGIHVETVNEITSHKINKYKLTYRKFLTKINGKDITFEIYVDPLFDKEEFVIVDNENYADILFEESLKRFEKYNVMNFLLNFQKIKKHCYKKDEILEYEKGDLIAINLINDKCEDENFKFFKEVLSKIDGFVAGGVFKDLIKGKKPKDYDVFFKSIKEYNKAIGYLSTNTKEYEYIESLEGYYVRLLHKKSNNVLELNCRSFGTPAEVISKFDFDITKMALVYVNPNEFKVICSKNMLDNVKNDTITINKNIKPTISTLERIKRYKSYGYSFNPSDELMVYKKIINFDNIDYKLINPYEYV